MKKVLEWVKNNPNRAMFLVPIILVAGISISHVVSWYDIANPISWAIYLSIAIEVGAMTALVAATNKIKGGVWFMFGLVTFIQMIGNIFFSYKEIDENGELFKSWVELTLPVWENLGTDVNDIPSLKRWLAFLEGGLLPIISLTSLHFFIKYKDNEQTEETKIEIREVEKIVEVPVEIEKIVEKPVETIKEVEKIVEVPVEVIKEVEKIVEVPVEVIKEVEKIVEVPVNYYINEVGEVYDENGHSIDSTTTTTTDNIKRLSYTK
jgi:ribosomal protein L13E